MHAADGTQAFASTKRFLIERELGHGGMGIVYQALDLERNTQVALKALTQRDAVNIYRLKNEFRQLADLSHPNLVVLHELCNEGNAWFFTMELVKGQSFDLYVAEERLSLVPHNRAAPDTARGGRYLEASITLSQRAIGSEFPLPRVTCNLKRLRHALRQLVEAVAALHDAGKLHRDIKPSNVLVTAEGRVVVLDFGLVSNSTVLDADAQDAERTVGGCMFGTPAYMSPEQASGDTVTMAADWYAVGTMLYEALTGQLPFEGSVLDILRQKETSEPVPPSEIVRGVPDDLDQLCRDLLRRDPNKRLSGPDILRYLTGHSAPPPVFDAESSNIVRKYGELFVGRQSHLVELRTAFEQSRNGKPTAVLVHGLSGMGKSALVRCFANELIRNDEAVVLRGRCYERETVPYKAFDNIIDALSRYMMRLPADEAAELLPRNIYSLAVLFPVLRRVKAIAHARRPKHTTADARELRNQAFGALKDLLLRITDFHPLVINIDDLQWADMDSARLLSFLMGPPDPPPLLLVGTYRRDEAENSPFLRHIVGEHGLGHGGAELRELALDALSEDEARQLSTTLLRDFKGVNALSSSAIAAEAEGVPFFIAELVQHLKSHHERADLPISSEPVSLDDVIMERVAGMPEPAQRLLAVLSVAAGPLEQGVAAEAAGLTRGDRTATLALRAARLIRTRGTRQSDSAETYHDRVRETVVKHLEPQRVRKIHGAIAAALERNEVVDPERLVVHYSGAGDGGRAGETAVQAAHAAAAKLAFNRAAELFLKAIELLSGSEQSTRELYKHMGDALANAGRGAQAAEAYLKAAEGLDAGHSRAMQRMAAQQYLRSGRLEEGSGLASTLLETVGIVVPESFYGKVSACLWNDTRDYLRGLRLNTKADALERAKNEDRLATLAALHREFGIIDPLLGAILQSNYLRAALDSGDPSHVLRALAWEAFARAWQGGSRGIRRAFEALAIVDTLAEEAKTPYATAIADMTHAATSLCLGEFHEVAPRAKRAELLFQTQCTGAAWERTLVSTFRYCAIEQTADFRQVLTDAPILEREARERDDRFATGFLSFSVPLVHLMKDDPRSAAELLEEQSATLGPDFGTYHMWIMTRTVDVLLYEGRGREALEYLSTRWPVFAKSLLYRLTVFRISSHYLHARALLAAYPKQLDAAARKHLKRDLAVLDSVKRSDATCLADLIRAAIAHRDQAPKAAVAYLNNCSSDEIARRMKAFSLYAERSIGAVLPADQSKTVRADEQLSSTGIQQPDRWARTFAPVFE